MPATPTLPPSTAASAIPARAWIRIDGEVVSPDAAAVSVFDHGLLYGDGIFESMRFTNGRVFELDAHLDRLRASAHVLQLALPYTPEELRRQVTALVQDTGESDGYIRLLVTRGPGDLGIDPRACPRACVILIAAPVTMYDEQRAVQGVRVVTLAGRQRAVDLLSPRIKSLNYLPNVLARLDARAAGADEGLFLTPEGYVSEGTGDNIFIVRDGGLIEPDPACGGLAGITADAVRRLAAANGVSTDRAWLTRYDLFTADEVFLTGTAVGLVPVVEIDGRRIGLGARGPITQRMQALLAEAMARGSID